ncbi:FkbM family methyltransferase [Thiocapsa roseopersicina]|uniref:Methyltransferase, FkbM family n=1 Tax=Thiocapsa roseopersicina TaxID=1058 RepID=A0A1H3C1L3_THIRO|nr:FkbM family methyltransferase [Thiocapsa roseopersicina]SDX47986.1 methyltransferase, FkbM family [Thiocapsa roseopersicina]
MSTDRGNARGDGLRAALGVARSLKIYYLHGRRSRMDAFYRAFLAPQDLAFDIGSHVGDRIGCFRRIGARVLAVEPQPVLVRTLRWLYGRDPAVRIEATAVGRASGRADLRLNRANPTVSTLSTGFISAAREAPGWEGQHWDGAVEVACTRLDDLIERHGMPRFIKIDVEGYEAEVLGGLTRPVDALSFEFTTIQKDVARSALAECSRLGYVRFNAVLGESYVFVHDVWVDAAAIGRWLEALPHTANSGDIYARRVD